MRNDAGQPPCCPRCRAARIRSFGGHDDWYWALLAASFRRRTYGSWFHSRAGPTQLPSHLFCLGGSIDA